MYSFGMMLYQMQCKEPPYQDLLRHKDRSLRQSTSTIVLKICDGFRPTIPDDFPPWLLKIAQLAWNQDSSLRPSFAEMAVLLAKAGKDNFKAKLRRKQTMFDDNLFSSRVKSNRIRIYQEGESRNTQCSSSSTEKKTGQNSQRSFRLRSSSEGASY